MLTALTVALFTATSWLAVDGSGRLDGYPEPVQLVVISVTRLAWIPPALLALAAWMAQRLGHAQEEGARRERAEADRLLRATVAQDAEELAERLDSLARAAAALTVHLQPIIDLRTGRPAGYEALARFPIAPYHPPDWWFTEAHRLGRGIELECAAIGRALAYFRVLPEHAYLSLNLSPTTLHSPELERLVSEYDPSRVVLELTEHDIVDDYETLNRNVGPLLSHGVRLAVDDAGAGFASLRHILNLAPAIVKLDRSLVADIDSDRYRRSLTSSLLRFAAEAGVEVVAEGVEREEELHTLVALGVPMAQGFLLGRPAPAAQVVSSQVQAVLRCRHRATPTESVELEGRTRTIDLLEQHSADG